MGSGGRRRGMGRQEYTNRLLWGLGNKSLGEEEPAGVKREGREGKIRLRAAEGKKKEKEKIPNQPTELDGKI